MAAVAPIATAIIAAGSATYSVVSSSKQRADAQALADRQRKEQETLLSNQKAREAMDQQQQAQARELAKDRQAAAANQGFNSTVTNASIGASGDATQGQKSLIGS